MTTEGNSFLIMQIKWHCEPRKDILLPLTVDILQKRIAPMDKKKKLPAFD